MGERDEDVDKGEIYVRKRQGLSSLLADHKDAPAIAEVRYIYIGAGAWGGRQECACVIPGTRRTCADITLTNYCVTIHSTYSIHGHLEYWNIPLYTISIYGTCGNELWV